MAEPLPDFIKVRPANSGDPFVSTHVWHARCEHDYCPAGFSTKDRDRSVVEGRARAHLTRCHRGETHA